MDLSAGRPRAIILDCDGVIVDSEPLHYESFRSVLAGEGILLSEEDYYTEAFAAASTDAALFRLVFEKHGRPFTEREIEALVAAKTALVDEGAPDAPLIQPTLRFARAAREAGFALGVCSGERAGFVKGVLERAGMLGEVDVVVGCGDAEGEKPDPGPYLEAYRRLALAVPGLTPSDCIVVEDSPVGCAAGRAAGMRVVGLTTSNPAAALVDAHLVVDELTGLDAATLVRRMDAGGRP